MELLRTVQCKKCPWKVSINPLDIPDGYCPVKHANLKRTIADKEEIQLEKIQSGDYSLNAMSCHHSNGNDQMYCIGWLYNQLGEGNNIALRIKMMNYSNAKDIKIIGKQHKTFEDTLPK